MRHLQPLIDQFVEDVLHLVRRATIEDLRGLVVDADGDREPAKPRVVLPRDLVPREVARRAPTSRHGLRQGPRVALSAENARPSSATSSTPAPVAEITDPESLLAAIALEPPVVVTPAAPTHERGPELDGDGPPSAVRPVHDISPVRLMGNETLARVSSAGVVIRRGRRA